MNECDFIDLFKDQHGGPIRKRKRPDIPKFLAFIRSHICSVPRCTNASEVHHPVFKSKGNSCSDALGVPLCSGHHTNNPDSVHVMGQEAFEARHGIEFHRIVIELWEEWASHSEYYGF